MPIGLARLVLTGLCNSDVAADQLAELELSAEGDGAVSAHHELHVLLVLLASLGNFGVIKGAC
jgi:hypothetical protein